eukprot:3026015-Prymnesium_polylepis.1
MHSQLHKSSQQVARGVSTFLDPPNMFADGLASAVVCTNYCTSVPELHLFSDTALDQVACLLTRAQ